MTDSTCAEGVRMGHFRSSLHVTYLPQQEIEDPYNRVARSTTWDAVGVGRGVWNSGYPLSVTTPFRRRRITRAGVPPGVSRSPVSVQVCTFSGPLGTPHTRADRGTHTQGGQVTPHLHTRGRDLRRPRRPRGGRRTPRYPRFTTVGGPQDPEGEGGSDVGVESDVGGLEQRVR